ncbi:MAG TPA: hypothetical protein VMS88_04785, partial [Terriglobales bacterium]|nr:hypothetical protein [Terriglobales bacterium]
ERPIRVPACARGEVLARLEDDVRGEDLLPSGARLDELRARISSLAGQVLSGRVPDFAERARARCGGFLVAGGGFGRGDGLVPAALCLNELGVHAVLAESYAPCAARTLVHAGVVPLLLASVGPSAVLACGDELELPGLLDRLRPDAPLEARNMTRGTRIPLRHELAVREIAILRSGGLVAFALRARSDRGEA